jgi:hypothetical protein
MAGFLLAIPGIKKDTGMPYLHSHMLGVLPHYRDAGVGRMLKMAQREDALSRGISLIEWSFDPFEAKNAYFNLEVLGAIVRTYTPNMYGITASRLHGDLPTDRCIAEWRIAEPPEKGQVTARVSLPPHKTRESQAALARAAMNLSPILDEPWRKYLALPAEVFDPARHPSPQALESSLQRFNAVAQNPQYQGLTSRSEFQAAHQLLQRVSDERRTANSRQLVLPPPPQVPR